LPVSFRQSTELDDQSSGLSRIRNFAARFAGSQIYVSIRQTRRRIKNREQTSPEIVRHREKFFITGDLIVRQQSAENPDRDLEILNIEVLIKL
jgi:hypothetical protein